MERSDLIARREVLQLEVNAAEEQVMEAEVALKEREHNLAIVTGSLREIDHLLSLFPEETEGDYPKLGPAKA